ncbi:UbiA prenyltransferase family [Mycena belliarum]|uniref:UbiA prenyltransferase family n=1 Tax=Mycena belliarum TaxID=1033014 RepID=A0AAD6TQL2_9AGAR|nr:UbiA prenyltransferase family [Mycena belliae]
MFLFQILKQHALTLFLFTKSDIKTTLIPITILALCAAPVHHPSYIPETMFWIWLHLLQFDVSNQTLDPEEDALNKRDRPVPSGRITLRDAVILRWTLVPICWALSAAYSLQVFYSSVALSVLTGIYNELHAHAGHWLVRNMVNAAGFASFEFGSTLVARYDRSHLDKAGYLSVLFSAGIFFTTIQAQDFKDTEGDLAIGRQTLPIVFPSFSRKTVLPGMMGWSFLLTYMWQVDVWTGSVFIGLAQITGLRFLVFNSRASDQVSFYVYNVWLTMAHALPGYWRYYHKAM